MTIPVEKMDLELKDAERIDTLKNMLYDQLLPVLSKSKGLLSYESIEDILECTLEMIMNNDEYETYNINDLRLRLDGYGY